VVIKCRKKVKEVRPLLAMEGGSIELVSTENVVVKVRLSGTCGMSDEPIHTGELR